MNKKYQVIFFTFIALVVSALLVYGAAVSLGNYVPQFNRSLNTTFGGNLGTSLGTLMTNISGAAYLLQVTINDTGDAGSGGFINTTVDNATFWYSKDNVTWTRIGTDWNATGIDITFNVSWDTTALFGGEVNNLSILVFGTNVTGRIYTTKTSITSWELANISGGASNITNLTIFWFNNATVQAKGNITGVLIDNLAPRIVNINVTARMVNGSILGNTITNGSLDGTGFIQNYTDNENGLNLSYVQIAVQIADLHASSVLLVYNTTNGVVNSSAINITLGGVINFTGTADNPIRVDNSSNSTVIGKFVIPMKNITAAATGNGNLSRFPANPSTWLVNITKGNFTSVDKSNLTFVIIINDTVSHFTIDSRTVAGYKVAFDNGVPVPTLTLSATSIEVLGSVTITCSATDPGAGINGTKTEIYLQKPSATSLSIFTTGQETVTLSGSDTGEAGTYYTSCIVEDTAGSRVSTSALSFTASYGTAPSPSPGGGPPSEKEPTTPIPITVDVDLSKATVSEETIAKAEGASSSFTVDGKNKHTITIDKVMAASVTITIASDPITMTLNVGETKEVTLDGQKLGITLKGIISGQAQLTIKKLGAVAPTTPTTEQPTTPTTGEEPTEEARSYTWLWVLIVLVIIAVLAVYFVKKKKPY